MTNEQAAEIIALLKSIDERLEFVMSDGANVTILNERLTVETDQGRPLEVYEAKF